MDKITRKELKSDHFALEVEHGVDYVADHKKQFIQYGAIAAVVIVLLSAFFWYRSYQHGIRQDALSAAIQVQNASIGPPQNEFMTAFPTQADKDKATNKAFTDLATKYSGSDEAYVAEYFLGANAADKGDLAQAEKRFKLVAENASAGYASLAKLSLADIYKAENKTADAEKVLKSVIDSPTVLVSKEQATIALAHLLAPTNPAEARKLLEPLRGSQRSAISRAALSALGELPPK